MAPVYHVIKFVNTDRPFKYAIVPESWVKIRRSTDNLAVVVCPDDMSKECVVNNTPPAENWKNQLCEIQSSSGDFNAAILSLFERHAGSVEPILTDKVTTGEKRKSEPIDLTEEASSKRPVDASSQVKENKTPNSDSTSLLSSKSVNLQRHITQNTCDSKTREKNELDDIKRGIQPPFFSTPKIHENCVQNPFIHVGFDIPSMFRQEEATETPYSVESNVEKNKNVAKNSTLKSPEALTSKSQEKTQNNTSEEVRKVHFAINKNTPTKELDPSSVRNAKEAADDTNNLTNTIDGSISTKNYKQKNKRELSQLSVNPYVVKNFMKFLNKTPNLRDSEMPAKNGMKLKIPSAPGTYTPNMPIKIIEDDIQYSTSGLCNYAKEDETFSPISPNPEIIKQNTQTYAAEVEESKILEQIRTFLYDLQKKTNEMINTINDYTSKTNIGIDASKDPNISSSSSQQTLTAIKRWTLKHQDLRPGLIPLMRNTNVYVNEARLRSVTSSAKTAATLIRMLLLLVFSEMALKGPQEFLDKQTLRAIFRYVTMVCRQKGWSVVDFKTFNAYVYIKLQEIKLSVKRTSDTDVSVRIPIAQPDFR